MTKKVNLGGNRLGSGAKINQYIESHGRSSFNLSKVWRSDMNVGTLVPFMQQIGLAGTTFDIKLNSEVFTLPTIGPMFGSYKLQLDVFKIPVRLYSASLHMNMVDIGKRMEDVLLPTLKVKAKRFEYLEPEGDPNLYQISSSGLHAYLGTRGVGQGDYIEQEVYKDINANFHLAYWDVYKNYYANKQEKVGKFLNHSLNPAFPIVWSNTYNQAYPWTDLTFSVADIVKLKMYDPVLENITELTPAIIADYLDNTYIHIEGTGWCKASELSTKVAGISNVSMTMEHTTTTSNWDGQPKKGNYTIQINCTDAQFSPQTANVNIPDLGKLYVNASWIIPYNSRTHLCTPIIDEFPLSNIDDMRLKCLQQDVNTVFNIEQDFKPYNQLNKGNIGTVSNSFFTKEFSQNMLGIKTFQSDRFNNWLDSEWIDSIGVKSAVSTVGDSFTMDSLNLAKKVYKLENQIAVAGGSYQDWQDVVYGASGGGTQESPMYVGGAQAEISFSEVVSKSAVTDEPLGTLAGKGNKFGGRGGNIIVKCSEPCMVLGIVSITPRLDYSQGNKWFNEIATMDDFHKPSFDSIAFQDLIVEEAAAFTTERIYTGDFLQQYSGGKQTSWIEYQTDVNECYGGFAEPDNLMFMVNNRQYEWDPIKVGNIADWTTYIDPSKFNYCFADTSLNSMNFWIGIGTNVTCRRVMSSKQIPNL